MTTFEAFRTVTGWERPTRSHGCAPVEIVPGVWTAHYHDIDSKAKLAAATNNAPIALVVNSALCQCEARAGFWGGGVAVMEIALEDDPDARKAFDQGKAGCQSECRDGGVPDARRCAGDVAPHFEPCIAAMEGTLATGKHVLVHCHASLSRSAALLLAYLMKTRKLSLADAAKLMKAKWDATWPNDRCDRGVSSRLFCF